MTDDELVILTQPYSNLLTALGGLRDNETITDKRAYRDAKKKLKADRRAQLKAARFARKKQKVTAPALDTAETATTSP